MQIQAEQVTQYRQLLTSVIDSSLKDMRAVQFDKNDPTQLAVACIYATIVQSATECQTVLTKPSITIGGMLRSIAESYADLCALFLDTSYIERMIATFTDQKRQLLESMRRAPENPFHNSLAQYVDVAADLSVIMAELAEYKKRGIEPLKIWQRFKCGDIMDLYQSWYWQLALQGHNNVSAIEARHIIKRDDNFIIVPVKNNRPDELIYFMDALISILIDSSERTHVFLKTPNVVESYQSFAKDLDSLRRIVNDAMIRA